MALTPAPVLSSSRRQQALRAGDLAGRRAARGEPRRPRGRVRGDIGESGSGKTTLLGILGCLDRPTRARTGSSGEEVDARPRRARARSRPAHRLRVPGLQPAAAVDRLRNVELPLVYTGASRARAPRRVLAAWPRSASRSAPATARTSFPAASSSASRSRARSYRPSVLLRRRADRQPRLRRAPPRCSDARARCNAQGAPS